MTDSHPVPVGAIHAASAANEAAGFQATPAAVASRRLLPLEADMAMLLHAQLFMATHELPSRENRTAQLLWIRKLYRVMAAVSPMLEVSEEDVVHALAHHCGCGPHDLGEQANVTRLRAVCESAITGLRVV
jgi:hypothetical protein